jgi:CheY-like chemotaxis protein
MSRLLGGIRILIVEDNEDNRVVLQESLRFQGAGVEAVAPATKAADMLDRFDIVVTDYAMPDHDAEGRCGWRPRCDGGRGGTDGPARTAGCPPCRISVLSVSASASS